MEKCFADSYGTCTLLKQKENCQTCNFYQTHAQVEISRKRSLRRLKSLDEVTRKHIAEKYDVKGIV